MSVQHDAAATPDEAAAEPMPPAEVRAGTRVLATLILMLGLVAVAVAAVVVDWRLLGIGIVLAFAVMALFGLPVWLASAKDAADEEKAHPQAP